MFNQGTLLGRVGKIDTKSMSNGNKVTNISLITSKKYMSQKTGQREEIVTWHNVVAFNQLAEIAEKYVNMGDLILVQGEMENQKYTDTNGQERTKYQLKANRIDMMPRTKEHQAPAPVADNPYVDDGSPPW